MRPIIALSAALALAACAGGPAPAGTTPQAAATAAPAAVAGSRPRPYPVTEIRGFRRAVERGTRTRTGQPGPRYWQQYARYQLAGELDPATNRFTGRGTLRYANNSPDTLRYLMLHLHQNLFRDSALRNEIVPLSGGVTITSLAVNGQPAVALTRGTGWTRGAAMYAVQSTVMRVQPPAPIAPGDTATLQVEWSFAVTRNGPRGGQDGEVWVMSYWYPQFAVYDDVNGWQFDPYLGNAEFYMGYADYDVALMVPEGWLIGATGALANAEEVLTPQARARLAQSRTTRGTTTIVSAAEAGAGQATARGQNGRLTWRFRATNVRDFTWTTSNRYQWDATIAEVGDATGDGRPDTAAAYSFWRPGFPAWRDGARYVQYSVEFLSRWLWPYPWPTMTAVNGVPTCGGMEYPMLTCVSGGEAPRESTGVMTTILHETAHMWFPMMVGSDEKRFAWQDEGLTTFNTDRGEWEYTGGRDGPDPWRGSKFGYLGFARGGDEVELMRHGDLYPLGTPAYGVASYPKMASNTAMLMALIGDSTFLRAYRSYGRTWMYHHPTPYDFFNTFNQATGRDLSWFWRTWWYETWTLDQAIADVRADGDALVVTVEDRGWAPMPARLVATRADNTTARFEVPVETWLNGATRATVRIPGGATVTRVEIDPEVQFADVDRTNNVWRRP